MSERRSSARRRVLGLAAAGASAAAAAAWTAQHRRPAAAPPPVKRRSPRRGSTLPDYVIQHDIEADDGGRLHVIERGRGPVVMLLHGFMLSSELWTHQLRDLAENHRVIAPDLRGHGQSVPGSAGFAADVAHALEGPLDTARTDVAMAAAQKGSPAIRRMAADLATVLNALDVEHAVLVGHSMGGMVALQYLRDTPVAERARRVAGMALVSTTAGPFSQMPGLGRMARLAGPVSSRAIHLGERWGVRAATGDVRFWLTRLGFGPDAPARQVRFVEGLHLATPPFHGACTAALAGALRRVGLAGGHGPPRLGGGGLARPPHTAAPRLAHRRGPAPSRADGGAAPLRAHAHARTPPGIRPAPRRVRRQGGLTPALRPGWGTGAPAVPCRRAHPGRRRHRGVHLHALRAGRRAHPGRLRRGRPLGGAHVRG